MFLHILLKNNPWLSVCFRITGRIAESFRFDNIWDSEAEKDEIYDDYEDDDLYDADPFDGISMDIDEDVNSKIACFKILKAASRLETLQELDFITDRSYEHDWQFPAFQNLRKFCHMGAYYPFDNRPITCIVDMLLSSPALSHLSLSRQLPEYAESRYLLSLLQLIKLYDQYRQELDLPLVQLSHLHLGEGYMPYEAIGRPHNLGRDYLSHLTDLSTLNTLELDNSPMNSSLLRPEFFSNATSLRCLRFQALSKDMQELMLLPNLKRSLVEIEIKEYFQQPHSLLDIDDDFTSETYVLRNTEPQWKKLHLLGDPRNDPTEAVGVLREVVLKAPQLEVLSISATKTSFEFLKDQVLPVLSNLRVLFVTSRCIVNLGDEEEIDEDEEDEEDEDDYTDGGKRLMNATAQVAKDALVAVYCARQIFQINRMLALTRAEHQPLQYVGCHKHIYTCVPLVKEDHDDSIFFISHRDANGNPTTAYYRVVEMPEEEDPDFSKLNRVCGRL